MEPSDPESNLVCQVPVKRKVAVKQNPNFSIYVQQMNFLVHAHQSSCSPKLTSDFQGAQTIHTPLQPSFIHASLRTELSPSDNRYQANL